MINREREFTSHEKTKERTKKLKFFNSRLRRLRSVCVPSVFRLRSVCVPFAFRLLWIKQFIRNILNIPAFAFRLRSVCVCVYYELAFKVWENPLGNGWEKWLAISEQKGTFWPNLKSPYDQAFSKNMSLTGNASSYSYKPINVDLNSAVRALYFLLDCIVVYECINLLLNNLLDYYSTNLTHLQTLQIYNFFNGQEQDTSHTNIKPVL